jgi:ubiquinone/menaquinone biosynthesis C-methylase UbiE
MINNIISLPMYEIDENGHIRPNNLFHRTSDKCHSRCIEYPFAASQLGDSKIILDVGSAKGNQTWISWLDTLSLQVYVTDYDELEYPVKNVKFIRSDIRNLKFADNTFDTILAVSVIEHIGLENPQVFSEAKPPVDTDGDIQAFKELIRVVKPGGQVIMTFPFGIKDELILNNQARNYTLTSIKKFSKFAKPIILDYYEYQYSDLDEIYHENPNILYKLKKKILNTLFIQRHEYKQNKTIESSKIIGPVTWRCIPIHNAKATNQHHIDGVLCGSWGKNKKY